jgi:hypothetical protein
MLWTAMPKAAIDEHGNAGLGKNEVCDAAKASERALVNPVAKSLRMKKRPQSNLDAGVLRSL